MTTKFEVTGTCLIAALLISCSPEQKFLHPVTQVRSPDGLLTATHLEDTQGGAMVGTGQDVYIQQIKAPFRYSERVFSKECVKNLGLAWVAERKLRISYDTGSDDLTKDGWSSKPWWRLNPFPVYGVEVQIAPRSHPGEFC